MGGCLAKGASPFDAISDANDVKLDLPKVSPQQEEEESYPENGKKLRTDAQFEEVYEMGKTIGSGAFSKVKLVTHRETGEQYACKVIPLPKPGHKLNENMTTRASIMKEIDVLLDLEHPNVINLKEYFVWHNRVYLVMELLRGGELLDAVVEKGHYSEEDAQVVFAQLARGVQYLHSMGVVHRDLKLDNLLLARPGDISSIKIADFGFAKKHPYGAALHTTCGTPEYMAPEVVVGVGGHKTEYDDACDLWACGVLLFILLGGYPPFQDESDPRLFRKIRKGAYDFNDPVWRTVSSEAKDLICKLLVVDPGKRLTAEQVLEHPWVASAAAAAAASAAAPHGSAETKARLTNAPRRHSGTASQLSTLCEEARETYARSNASRGSSPPGGSPHAPYPGLGMTNFSLGSVAGQLENGSGNGRLTAARSSSLPSSLSLQ